MQRREELVGPTLDAIRKLLTPWLGEPQWRITERSAKLVYSYQRINQLRGKLKIEINTTEHFQVLPLILEPFHVDSEWFQGTAQVATYELTELMATKLRALYQRRKGRDLFDLWYVFQKGLVEVKPMLEAFEQYYARERTPISRKLFQGNLELKKLNEDFKTDMHLLLPYGTQWDFEEAYQFVMGHIINKLP